MKFLRNLLIGFVYALPAALFLSYHPVIKIGENSAMNFELSLSLIWLVLFDILVVIYLVLLGLKNRRPISQKLSANRRQSSRKSSKNSRHHQTHPASIERPSYTRLGFNFPGISDRRIFLLSLFPFFATLSIFWSANPLRAFLTAGIIWLIFLAIFALLYLFPLLDLPQHFARRLLVSFFAASLFVCIVCWLQSLLDILSVSRDQTLLCLGCTYHSFGFPHPSGFAIEPQFMGNLLLAPTLTALYLLTKRRGGDAKASREEQAATTERAPRKDGRASGMSKVSTHALVILTCVFSATLFLTFSRGAIYAYAIGLLILLIFAVRRAGAWRFIVAIPVLTFAFVLAVQGTFSALGPTSETFTSGIAKSLNHLSLGLIDLRPNAEDSAAVASDTATLPASTPDNPAAETAIFDGYVAESTDVRLNLNTIALQTWLYTPSASYADQDTRLSWSHLLFGVGLGGAGVAMYEFAPETIGSPKEIVQNQPISLLLELGLVGVALIIFSLLLIFLPQLFPPKFLDGRTATTSPAAFKPPKTSSAISKTAPSSPIVAQNSFWQSPLLPLLLSLLVAYFVTLNFFSGLPNALQIYLMPPLLYLWGTLS